MRYRQGIRPADLTILRAGTSERLAAGNFCAWHEGTVSPDAGVFETLTGALCCWDCAGDDARSGASQPTRYDMMRLERTRRLGRQHGRAGTTPYGDLDADDSPLMTALGETGPTTEDNHPRRLALLEAYRDAYARA